MADNQHITPPTPGFFHKEAAWDKLWQASGSFWQLGGSAKFFRTPETDIFSGWGKTILSGEGRLVLNVGRVAGKRHIKNEFINQNLNIK